MKNNKKSYEKQEIQFSEYNTFDKVNLQIVKKEGEFLIIYVVIPFHIDFLINILKLIMKLFHGSQFNI